jgi:hypothetical protein
VLAIRQTLGHQAAASQRFRVVDDQRRIHQHNTVIANQRRRLDHRVDRAELVEGTEYRHRFMRERQVEQAQRDGDAAYVGRIEHPDQSHFLGSGGWVTRRFPRRDAYDSAARTHMQRAARDST